MATHSKGENVTKTVSMDTDLLVKAEQRRRNMGLPSFSYYVRKLIAEDLEARGELILREEAQHREPTSYLPPKKGAKRKTL